MRFFFLVDEQHGAATLLHAEIDLAPEHVEVMGGRVVPRGFSAGCFAVRITAQPAATCKIIFTLPSGDAGMMRPSTDAISRRPMTINSRPMMMTTIQACIRPISTSEMNAAEIRSLSAMGSRRIPSVVISLRLRAR